MADAAERQALFTFLEVIGLGAVVVLTLLTLRQAVRAQGSDRAWLVPVNPGLIPNLDGPAESSRHIRVVAKWKNSGKTPARDVHCNADFALVDPKDNGGTVDVQWSDGSLGSALVGPGVT